MTVIWLTLTQLISRPPGLFDTVWHWHITGFVWHPLPWFDTAHLVSLVHFHLHWHPTLSSYSSNTILMLDGNWRSAMLWDIWVYGGEWHRYDWICWWGWLQTSREWVHVLHELQGSFISYHCPWLSLSITTIFAVICRFCWMVAINSSPSHLWALGNGETKIYRVTALEWPQPDSSMVLHDYLIHSKERWDTGHWIGTGECSDIPQPESNHWHSATCTATPVLNPSALMFKYEW